MSRDVEAGIRSEEEIPLVAFASTDSDDTRCYQEYRIDNAVKLPPVDHQRLKPAGSSWIGCGWGSSGTGPPVYSLNSRARKIVPDKKHRIIIRQNEDHETFKLMKIKRQTNPEEIFKDAVKIADAIGTKNEAMERLICVVDNCDDVHRDKPVVPSTVVEEKIGPKIFVIDEFNSRGLRDKGEKTKIVAIVSGVTVFDDEDLKAVDYNKLCVGAIFPTVVHEGHVICDCNNEYNNAGVDFVVILEGAFEHDILNYKLAIVKAFSQKLCHCTKLINNVSEETVNSIVNGLYFEDGQGTLVVKSDECASELLHSFVQAYKNCSSELENTEYSMLHTFSQWVDAKMMIEIIKQNSWSFFTHDPQNSNDLLGPLTSALSVGLRVNIIFLADTSKEIVKKLSSREYLISNAVTVILKSAGGLPLLLANYKEYQIYNEHENKQMDHFKGINHMFPDANLKKNFLNNINENISKFVAYDLGQCREDTSLVSKARAKLHGMEKHELLSVILHNLLPFQEFTVPEMISALQQNNMERVKQLLNWRMEMDTFILCNLKYHWQDKDERQDTKVADHFGITKTECNGKLLNDAIAKLSNGIIAKCFDEDGTPKLNIISPIQALIINRVFCLHFDCVKMLWKYDKQNLLVNSIMIWILVNGILKEEIFSRESGTNDLIQVREYFAAAIQWPLDQLFALPQHEYVKFFKCRVVLFKGNSLYNTAVDGTFYQFLCHTVTKRFVAEEWNSPNIEEVVTIEGNDDSKDNTCTKIRMPEFLKKPRKKLYIHMAMYVASYMMLAYCTIYQNGKAHEIVKWILFTMITSLFVDEISQALGDNKYKVGFSLKRWWSDNWNKVDFFSMMLYYTAFSLELAGALNGGNLLFSVFSFIWCLKFYQFLRAFESLGTYIILVQEMVPHLGNFAIVAMVAIISYGVFMTSILFPDIKFFNWSLFIMILLRPYLLLFAETGIEAYDLPAKNTMYDTPTIPKVSEILVIVGMCVFLMFGGVLLLNLLIAIFSGIYEDVKEYSERLWVFNDLQLLKEFRRKPALPIPISLPINIFYIIQRLATKVEGNGNDNDQTRTFLKNFQQRSFSRPNQQWVEEERESCDAILRRIDLQMVDVCHLKESSDTKMTDGFTQLNDNVNKLHDALDTRKSSYQNDMNASRSDIGELEEALHQTTNFLSRRLEAVEQNVDEQVRILQIQCQEMSDLLKQLVMKKEKDG